MPVNIEAMLEAALSSRLAPTAGRAALGAGAGAAMGGYVNPAMFGYEDNPQLTRASMLLNATLGGMAAGIGGQWRNIVAKDPRMLLTIPAGAMAGELVPVGMNLGMKATDAARALAQKPPTASEQVSAFAQRPETRGAAAGAAMAGLGGIVTGLLRPRRESEMGDSTSRLGMVKKDILTLLIPAMIAGGLIGHQSSRPSQA